MLSLRSFNGRGQAFVEFALVATVAMIVLFVAVQLALIGKDDLALGQMNYQGARWFAVNTCATSAQAMQYVTYAGSPAVVSLGGTCGAKLTMTAVYTTVDGSNHNDSIAGTVGSCGTLPTVANTACADGLEFGTPVTLTLSLDARKAIFLGDPNSSWTHFLITFPTTLTSTETTMAE